MAEGGGLLNRYTLVKAYRGFESLRLRHHRVFSHFVDARAHDATWPPKTDYYQTSQDLLDHDSGIVHKALSDELRRKVFPKDAAGSL